MTTWFHSFLNLLIPRQCVVCGRVLSHSERCICIFCNVNIPRTNFHLQKDNFMEKLFWGQLPIERATAFYYYEKGGDYRRIIHQLKYNGRQDIGKLLGRCIAHEAQTSGFFGGIDMIVPVPLHPKKFRKRGYNQSECIAQGISEVTGIPIETEAIRRKIYTESQTGYSTIERWENVKGAFEAHQTHRLVGKHILLVDDVLTTGSTITACAQTLSDIDGVCFSIITLGIAR